MSKETKLIVNVNFKKNVANSPKGAELGSKILYAFVLNLVPYSSRRLEDFRGL